MKVKSIKKIGKREVCDLSVQDVEHYILQNGIVSHNTAVTYAANQIFIITKAQEKEGETLSGYKFTINIHKSRNVLEKSKFPLIVSFNKGINKWSGLFDLALEEGYIVKASAQLYTVIDKKTGEAIGSTFKRKEKEYSAEFWKELLDPKTGFTEHLKNKFQLSASISTDDGEGDVDNYLEEDKEED